MITHKCSEATKEGWTRLIEYSDGFRSGWRIRACFAEECYVGPIAFCPFCGVKLEVPSDG